MQRYLLNNVALSSDSRISQVVCVNADTKPSSRFCFVILLYSMQLRFDKKKEYVTGGDIKRLGRLFS